MGLGGVAIATLPSVICAKLMFSDGLGGQSIYPCANAAWPHLLVFKLWLIFPCIF